MGSLCGVSSNVPPQTPSANQALLLLTHLCRTADSRWWERTGTIKDNDIDGRQELPHIARRVKVLTKARAKAFQAPEPPSGETVTRCGHQRRRAGHNNRCPLLDSRRLPRGQGNYLAQHVFVLVEGRNNCIVHTCGRTEFFSQAADATPVNCQPKQQLSEYGLTRNRLQ